MTPQARTAFIRAQTRPAPAPLCPEIAAYQASEITPIWQASEDFLDQHGIAPPYWAFVWPGSAALARYSLDHPAHIQGRRIIDFAAGSGVAGIAALRAGAAAVTAIDIDPMAGAALALNAELNGVNLMIDIADRVGAALEADLIFCGDICYEAPMAARLLPWLRGLARHAEIWLAEPGRAYAPRDGFAPLACYDVPVLRDLESRTTRTTHLLQLLP
ncbi:MAG TPA: 50S ribosomal protein L11 methyltransferase [Acidiphilium sp.]|nr:MAG: nicotinamide N-methylase [Acidiphilium sp. 21-60-14]OYV90797.1 MAG: nicotinamide N-methylase [Acidiphilium sp. 37-60-79]OZB38668.1 MAG: nicotinamide N-methylase [Acidiphilium sp. 34-60-192]HQT87336.1 50S ribosomal protein L11 methyltransferase [Acidiphilium sp.]HQU24690.1 50S ribosomal protein L11 methyltransferase [Acidiphilium sp.]